ncbi:CHASE2 domain-containing serine/threonine-protein kinase [Natronospira bacteriovora]|uniref:Serine/threonine-protein kinase n=1 Tax=Natronospira bacteriovora TaxID=3069753 RepID=A0ABU0W876_9GAMM|nr:serine/threonine-protein kinase [Natronospira sp. AB-CW4]MDQ2070235.1 serine/threonine-protein kinase [Natronospira sp. AB-CW4]
MKLNWANKDRFIGFTVTLLVALAGIGGLWKAVDGPISEWGMRLAPERAAGDRLILVEIDDDALGEYPDWTSLAAAVGETVSRVRRADAAVTALVLPSDWGLAGPVADAVLASRMDGLGPVLLGLPYRSWAPEARAQALDGGWLPDYLQASMIPASIEPSFGRTLQRRMTAAPPIPEGRLLPAFPGLADEVNGVGFLPPPADRRAIREPAALLRSDGRYLPALSLHVAAHLVGVTTSDIRVNDPSGISLGPGVRLPTDSAYRFQPHFYSDSRDLGIRRVSMGALLEGRVSDADLAGRAVLIGTTSGQWADALPTPLGERMSPVEVVAHHSTALIRGDLYSAPEWLAVLPWALLLVVGLYLAYLLPRLSLATSIAVTLLFAVLLFNIQLVMPMARMIRLDLAMPVVALLGGHALLGLKQYLADRRHVFLAELSDANRQLGEAWQAQGKLDAAFERFKRCQPGPRLLDQLYDLALDFERRRQFAKAQSVLKHIAREAPGFADVDARIRKLAVLESKMALGSGRGAVRSLVLTEDGMQKPMLGRYEIEKEIGRGAMGVVYLGRDPRIGRTVAVKTVALSEEFEGEQLEQVTARFFREAETAGRLNHPSIVTIYDVGEESDLAYIAMDYLDGSSLQRYTRPGKLLPVPTVFDIVAQVADALDYAHGHNVVHRDVKPGNMIYDRRTRRIKVTDFGVACLTDASKTKTGTILGTPSYMSPEQVLGRKVDGRSDLFSLGVTFFQMLRGELPFDGQPLATLMYKIANDRHPDVGHLRLDLPPCVGQVMDKALAKKPEDRFQRGSEMAQAIRQCRKQVVALAKRNAENNNPIAASRGRA